ncbi:unnamed protein product [Nesidiocoris tenuis]|uniref:Uncharacterized protein n=1 Tax=Nesidiocoris tenuis TaxID=355587 RepID=A0A6H5H8C3_9HEMI|nr:unnamed protein product [Nesidiocoris tenuis]
MEESLSTFFIWGTVAFTKSGIKLNVPILLLLYIMDPSQEDRAQVSSIQTQAPGITSARIARERDSQVGGACWGSSKQIATSMCGYFLHSETSVVGRVDELSFAGEAPRWKRNCSTMGICSRRRRPGKSVSDEEEASLDEYVDDYGSVEGVCRRRVGDTSIAHCAGRC